MLGVEERGVTEEGKNHFLEESNLLAPPPPPIFRVHMYVCHCVCVCQRTLFGNQISHFCHMGSREDRAQVIQL